MKTIRPLLLTLLSALILTATAHAQVQPVVAVDAPASSQAITDTSEEPSEEVHLYSPEVNQLAARMAAVGAILIVVATVGFVLVKIHEHRHPIYIDDDYDGDDDYDF